MSSAGSRSPAEPGTSPATQPEARYRAFISYSHRDQKAVSWLHGALERFRMPARLVGKDTPLGPVPARLTPIFRDRDELPASGNLGAELLAALRDSRFLLVAASPASAASRWCNEEILAFKRLHGPERVLALVVDGEPNARDPAREALAPALRFQLGPDGQLSDTPAEPIAADMRPEADGRRLAFLKIVAGLTGVRLDELVQREAQRRARRLTIIASGALAGMTLTSGLAAYAYLQRNEANRQRAIAEQETATATATADYLIGTFQLVNPATENPRTISAFEILSRSADRAAIELKDQPEILVRISDSLAQSYMNLGLYDEAASLLASRLPAINRTGAEGAAALSTLGETYHRQGKTTLARRTLDRGLRLLAGDEAAAGPAGDAAAARVLLALARVNRADGRNKEALAQLDSALARLAGSPRDHPLERARLLHTKGLVLLDDGDFAGAQAALEAAKASYVAELGPRHRLVGENLYDQAQNAYVAGKLGAALDLANQADAILSVILDATNPFRAHVLALKGQILFGQGQLAPARAALDQAVAIYRKALGGPSYVIGISEVYLGLIASGQGDTRAALAYLDDAKLNYDASYGELHPNHGDLLVNRAQVLARASRLAEARQDCARGIEILVGTLGADHSFTRDNQAICAGLGKPS